MAFTLNVANSGTATPVSMTSSGTPDLVIAAFSKDSASDPTGVTYGGVAMTRLTETINGAQGAEIWYLVTGIPAGTQNIAYTLAGAHRMYGGTFDTAGGTVAEFDVEAGTSGTSAGPSQAVTPTVQPNVIITVCAHEGAAAMTAKGTGQVGMEAGAGDGFIDEGTWNSAATYEPTTSTSADTQSFTNAASDTWSLRVAVFREAAGAADQNLTGAVFTKAPTFPSGTISAVYDLTGAVFTRAPTFPTGDITTSYELTGSVFTKAPTFPAGVLEAVYDLTGATFTTTGTFSQGEITAGVIHDAASESAVTVSVASYNWTHTPVGTPKGVLVFTFWTSTADGNTAVTYGGQALTAVSGGRALDTVGETGDCKAWFLGSSVPTGAQTVEVTRTNSTVSSYAIAVTVRAGSDTEVYTPGIALLQEDGTLAEQSVTDNSPGSASTRYAGLQFGAATTPGAGTSSTLLHDELVGTRSVSAVRETVSGQGARSVGWSSGTTDDRAGVHLAIREVVSVGDQTLTGATFTKGITFPQGTVEAAYDLTGVTLQKAPTFPTGAFTTTYDLTGAVFTKAPTFPTGTISLAGGVDQNLTGATFTKAATFPTGVFTTSYDLVGTVLQKAPTFPTGALSYDQDLTGAVFIKAPTFPQGVILGGDTGQPVNDPQAGWVQGPGKAVLTVGSGKAVQT